ncbi:MAG: hypothetical protein KatS3mg057_1664 [Herpetosiphonaceae bacterium]|nr:MAG: hypothetical protein KatS3mg057_1664 [Herpetosiphonaceae bacterium]
MHRTNANGDRSDIAAYNANKVNWVSRVNILTHSCEFYPDGCIWGIRVPGKLMQMLIQLIKRCSP